ncbi:myo-inositol-1(or 4)-monophosphatase [Pelagirhabdus alkalitolerans]|uniref:Myo-inositol-1(Or 4)-monophosphatase n=1 Tax=Pelagirhabdus alkalitolerans TaxID=1612202 RepID=A0A1G6GZ38_9BACI|nr:inositol monophosphatase family protein [Pelagirhabdus alkalitolerans]SDB87292.1 myo-inositol-1(or 4)-monophosphatase [Pelagirhabdus alkalitolerans]
MTQFDQESIYQQAKEWVLEAGAIIRSSIDQPREVDTKENANDLVTEMDKQTEEYFAKAIRSTYQEHRILSEEGFGDDVQDLDGVVWIIDPIDGTMNFVHQKQTFAISLAVFCDGVGEIGFVYDVMADCLYHAKKGQGAYKNEKKLDPLPESKTLEESLLMLNTIWCTPNKKVADEPIRDLVQTVRGTRSYGSAALEFCYLAEGIVDSYISFKLQPWDIAAGVVIFKEVGGVTSQTTGERLTFLHQDPIVSAHPNLINAISDYIELKYLI